MVCGGGVVAEPNSNASTRRMVSILFLLSARVAGQTQGRKKGPVLLKKFDRTFSAVHSAGESTAIGRVV